MHNPDDKPSNWFILFNAIGGIEYDGGGCVEKIKRRKSHIDATNQRAMEMPIN